MERLTDCAQGYCEMYCKKYGHCFEDPGDCIFKDEIKLYEAIKSIEGIVPFDRLLELACADKAGLLVMLPCKVGDSIYIPDLEKKIPVKVRVQGISISVSGRTILHFGGYPVECAWGDGCGKDWFLTRDEAEASLAQKGGTHEADSV